MGGANTKVKSLELSSEMSALALYIMETSLIKDHFFLPYYHTLPTNLSNFPVMWSDEELEWIVGSTHRTEVLEEQQEYKTDYDALVKKIYIYI